MARKETEVTPWLERLKAGDDAALQPLWQRYYAQIVRMARRHLPAGVHDSDAIADSAFLSFWRGMRAGRFPKLGDRHDLWRLLIFITRQKIADSLHTQNARKRGGGRKRVGAGTLNDLTSPEPTPEFVAIMKDELESFLDALGDDKLRQLAIWEMEGISHSEMARRLGCALRTVANKLELIRAILRERRDKSG
ncbi:MAG TPA: ECF-type sigma factor [Gemmataceae bacterium]|nr:ECF-type sigma factor [Gemmataceae bacterium]